VIICNYLAYVDRFAYLGYINVFDDGSIMKIRYQGLKAIRRSKLTKIESRRFERRLTP
jgi:arginine/ornithine N-succinyltransferase beta subunit